MKKVDLSKATKVGIRKNGLGQSKERKILRCDFEKKFPIYTGKPVSGSKISPKTAILAKILSP